MDWQENNLEPSPEPRRGRWAWIWKGGLLGLAAVAWAGMAVMPTGAVEAALGRIVQAGVGGAGSAMLREVWGVVSDRFYDPGLRGVDPGEVVAEFAGDADGAQTPEELRSVVNESLGRLGASHTRWFTPDEQAYYEVLDVFNPGGLRAGQVSGQPAGPVSYVGIGCVTGQIEGRRFVTDVYPGGPADRGGLHVGDEVVSVAGGAWRDVASFEGKARHDVEVVVRRARGGRVMPITVRPERIQPRRMFLDSIKRSARVEEWDGAHLAYVRIRSYAHESYQEALEGLMAKEFADADGLVLDLRGGWGGAQAQYTNAFNPALPHFEMRGRDGQWRDVARAWDRPVVLLVDRGTRSGKELVADALQRAGVATVVGTRTAGAVLGGTTFPLSDGSLLMVAVTDVRSDGRRLEGRGVDPDVQVERPIPYCDDADPQLDRAMEVLRDLVREREAL